MKRSQLVQLIGPITNVKDYNRPAFAAATKAIQTLGYEVWNPNDWSDLDFDPFIIKQPKEFWMRRSLLRLFNADMVVLLPGWRASSGFVYEFQVACALNLPIVYWSKWVSLYRCVKGAKCGLL